LPYEVVPATYFLTSYIGYVIMAVAVRSGDGKLRHLIPRSEIMNSNVP